MQATAGGLYQYAQWAGDYAKDYCGRQVSDMKLADFAFTQAGKWIRETGSDGTTENAVRFALLTYHVYLQTQGTLTFMPYHSTDARGWIVNQVDSQVILELQGRFTMPPWYFAAWVEKMLVNFAVWKRLIPKSETAEIMADPANEVRAVIWYSIKFTSLYLAAKGRIIYPSDALQSSLYLPAVQPVRH